LIPEKFDIFYDTLPPDPPIGLNTNLVLRIEQADAFLAETLSPRAIKTTVHSYDSISLIISGWFRFDRRSVFARSDHGG